MKKDTYSIFKVYDYKGGELSAIVNATFDDVMEMLAENIKHSELEYSEDIWDMSNDDITRVCTECDVEAELYAGGDEGWCGEIYRHKNRNLKQVSPSKFKPHLAEYIINNKEQ